MLKRQCLYISALLFLLGFLCQAQTEQSAPSQTQTWQTYQSLGDQQLNRAEYSEAIISYEKAVELASKATDSPANADKTNARRNAIAKMLTSEGNAYLKLRKNDDAIRLYTRAAEASPNPALAYFNLCATAYNLGDTERAISACRKSIEADPRKADAYFVLGSCLFANGKFDKDNHYIVPPGTLEVLNKYLELAPDGAHAADVKQMLAMIPGNTPGNR
jgi:tetratricopeptide (TPR) repeat protein